MVKLPANVIDASDWFRGSTLEFWTLKEGTVLYFEGGMFLKVVNVVKSYDEEEIDRLAEEYKKKEMTAVWIFARDVLIGSRIKEKYLLIVAEDVTEDYEDWLRTNLPHLF